MKTLRITAAGFATLAWLLGCGMQAHLQMKNLDERVAKYHDLYRWREYGPAASYLIPSVRKDFMAYTEGLHGNLNVSEYQIVKTSPSDSGREATVLVRRSFFLVPSATLQQEDLEQHWILLEGDWYLAGPPY